MSEIIEYMDTLLISTLVVLGLTAALLEWKKQYRLNGIFQTLFAVIAMLWMAQKFGEETRYIFYALAGITVVGFLAAQFIPKNKWIAGVVALVAGLGFYFGFANQTLELNEQAFAPETKFLVLGIVIAAIGALIADLKLKFLTRWMPEAETKAWLNGLYILFVGAAVFLGMTAPGIGLMIFGVTFLLSAFFRGDNSEHVGTSLIALSLLPLIEPALPNGVSLLGADVIFGLFLGALGMFLILTAWNSENPKLIPVTIAYFFGFVLVAAVSFAGKELELMGGLDALIAAIIGASLVNAFKGKGFAGISFIPLLFAFSLVLPSLIENKEEMEEEQEQLITMSGSTDSEGNEVKPPELLPLEELSEAKTWSIVEDSSQIQFKLGPNGANKGKFKKVNGSFIIAEDLSKSSVKVVLDMKDFTTFNAMRDEHLREEEYFHVSKYPKMRYNAQGFKKTGENTYETTGKFEMLGVSKEVTVTLQRVKVDQGYVIIGSGSLDRTEFGMTPSASEGNVVDFDFQVRLHQ